VVGSCAHSDQLSGSIRWGEYVEKMRKYCVSLSGRTLLHVVGCLVKSVYFRIPLVSLHFVAVLPV
jgi:hypothetical protein